jgi:hypothetical protein
MKWFLRDWHAPQRVVRGRFVELHRSDSGDEDTNVVIEPDAASFELIRNRIGALNADGAIEGEVCVGGDWRDGYEAWARTLIDGTLDGQVTAQGVWVDDDEHDSKTELHPVDVVFGSVGASALPEDWIGELAAELGLAAGSTLFATRFAAASDTRADDRPPLAEWSRPFTFTVPLPPRPPGDTLTPALQIRTQLSANATIGAHGRQDAAGGAVDVTILCTGAEYGGPGAVLGEIATFWTAEPAKLLVVTPATIPFGNVPVGEGVGHTVRIENAGQSDLAVTIAGSPPPRPFLWDGLATTALAAGAVLEWSIDFVPRGPGHAVATFAVQSDAAGIHTVALQGTGVKSGLG